MRWRNNCIKLIVSIVMSRYVMLKQQYMKGSQFDKPTEYLKCSKKRFEKLVEQGIIQAHRDEEM